MLQSLISAIKKNSEDEILKQLEELIKKEPQNGHHYLRMGDLLVKKGNLKEAVNWYLRASELFYKQGFLKKATASAKLVLRYEPNNEKAISLLERLQMGLTSPKEELAKKVNENATKLSIFSQLSSEEIGEMIKRAEKRHYKKGEYIIMEGDVGESLFVIEKGRVKVITTIAGKTIELAELGEGDIVGEVAILTDRPRTASVIALEETECFEMGRDLIMDILERHPELADALNEIYHQRVKDTITKVKRGG
ncbi:MAG: hypothetical protein D6778_06600 [Nitrospirae bacterium]|nr:MAG: hypothetical protein D6778_06600 [Nitrospirota bacterium]